MTEKESPNWDCPEKSKASYRAEILKLVGGAFSEQHAALPLINSIIDAIYSEGMDDGIEHVKDNPDMLAGPGREC